MKSIKVLIADDSAFIRKVISNILLENEQINIVAKAKDGRETIDLMRIHDPDVLLLDLIMPRMNGLDAFRIIIEEMPTPTIILSAVSPKNMDASVQALLIGAFDYIIKPGGLGTVDLPKFRSEILNKVLLASRSQIKRILVKENRYNSLRQKNIDETFKFGKYLNELKPIKDGSEKDFSDSNFKKEDKNLEDLKSIDKDNNQIKKVLKKVIKSEIPETARKIPDKNKEIVEKPEESAGKQGKTVERQKENTMKPKEAKREPKIVQAKKSAILSGSLTEPQRKEGSTIELPPKNSKLKIQKSNRKIIESKTSTAYMHKEIVGPLSKLIVIGASVGGPRTIRTILERVSEDLTCPIIIVQHLTAEFIESFVDSLNTFCKPKVKVAENGEFLENGIIYVAPGGMHTEVKVKEKKPYIETRIGTPVHFCIPSIDVLFASAAEIYGKKVLGILLTGMGEDGVDGLEEIKESGGKGIAESQETAILFGIPRLAAERGLADKVLPNYNIWKEILFFAKNGYI